MILSPTEMKALEERAFADGVSAETLMEEAGAKIAEAVRQFVPGPGRCLVYFGRGHNGGDALVAARHLAQRAWEIELHPLFAPEACSELTNRKHGEFRRSGHQDLHSTVYFYGHTEAPPTVVLDGLLGIGAKGALREPIRSAAREINHLRTTSNAHVFALDLPTGLDGETGDADPDTVVADFTLTIGCAKAGLVADRATHFVGRLAVLPLKELSARLPAGEPGLRCALVASPAALAGLCGRRSFETHKGVCGRVGIVAGSRGLTGAAIMAAEAAVHAGAGLVTLYVSPNVYPLVGSRIAPEVMVQPVDSYLEIFDARHDVLGIGPGLGRNRAEEVLEIIEKASPPVVIDADAINILGDHPKSLRRCLGPRLLTPHPGEMARLDPDSKSRTRRETVEAFTKRHPFTLLLKGARTIVGQRDFPLSYNTTGTPGMATGGMGDVLTGVCAALAGQKMAVYDAARLGAWLCGRAAELAVQRGGESEESLSATHVTAHLGAAFRELRQGTY
ncbi:MAG: NAD(P)H-hydrate dehydratase [Verrucomicrobiota bacterium]|nr:NAD(P)H-hydrate dehydratase [Verrucomicrobiota bacterium]